MSDRFVIRSGDLSGTELETEVERRAGSSEDPPPPELIPEAGQQPERTEDLFSQLLRLLSEDADAARGFPPQSHRPLGNAVVAAKRGFRLAFQPFINEALARQKLFNRRLLDALTALHAEQRTLLARLDRLEGQLRQRDPR